MNKIITKIFLATFALWFFSLWLNFVLAGTLTTVDSSNRCSEIINYSSNWYSTNSTNWQQYTTASNNVVQRYINQEKAIKLAASWNTIDQWVCKKNYIVGSNVFKTPWKLDLCNNGIDKLITHQTNLFKAYITAKNLNLPARWFVWHAQVWWLQNLMSQNDVKCHTNKDCKLWVNTTSNFLFCKVCSAINTNRQELKTLEPKKTCENWYIFTDDNLCCQPGPTQCLVPTITINWEINKTTYNDEEWNLEVVVDYSDNTVWNITFPDLNKVIIKPASALSSDKIADAVAKTITFSLSTIWTDSISINVEDWCAILETKPCPPVEIKINRKMDCQLTKDRKLCDNKSGFNITDESSFTWFASLLSDTIKCKKWSLEIPFCPDKCTSRKIDNQTCEQTYGSWSYATSKDPICCKDCWTNKKLDENDNCVCDTTKPCSNLDDRRNPKTCKCECDPTKRCCWILLNTVVPFIWDCIEMTSQNNVWSSNNENTSTVNQLNAFPFLMMWLSKIMVTAILIFSFLIVIVSGLMMVIWVYY